MDVSSLRELPPFVSYLRDEPGFGAVLSLFRLQSAVVSVLSFWDGRRERPMRV